MELLRDKVAVVTGTGGADSIGFATAALFAQHGATVGMIDIDLASLESAAAALGLPHQPYHCDVSVLTQCEDTVERIVRDHDRIDILINSAGVVRGTPVLDITQSEYDQVLDANLRGNFLMAQAVVPYMRAKGEGSIVCVSSIAGQSGGGVFGSSHYAAAKSGIFGLAKALARELAGDGVRVNAVAPGPIDNDFTKGKMTREIKNEIANKIPLGRLGRPEEVANACLFLASGLASYVTGTVLDVNGGLLIH